MEFTNRQTAYLLAALRHCQDIDIGYMDHFDEVEPLSVAEIDELCLLINNPPSPGRCYTVVGLYPDRVWDGEMRDATFVEHVEADTPNQAAQTARLQRAKNTAAGESEEELAESASDLAALAVFQGHLMDLYDPHIEQA